jgi:hypothetical protein
LVLLTGSQEAAKKIAKYEAAKSRIEDKEEIAQLVQAARTSAAQKSSDFKIELAAITDGMFGVTMGTYSIEGDGVTVFFSWEIWVIARESLRRFATDPESATVENLGFDLPNRAVWSGHLEKVKAIFLPAWNYMEGQIVKHSENLKFLEHVNRLCPWNAASLDRATLDYFEDLKFLTPIELRTIEHGELNLFQAHALTWVGCTRPTTREYLSRDSPVSLLPEARIWRFHFVHQKRIPTITLLLKRLASAQAHS